MRLNKTLAALLLSAMMLVIAPYSLSQEAVPATPSETVPVATAPADLVVVEAPVTPEKKTIPLAPIILALTTLTAILPFTSKLPGWATLSNIALGAVTAVLAAITTMAETSPRATILAICLAAFGGVMGYINSDKRNGVVPS